MVNAMATFSGDVQYSQNGTVTNPCGFARKMDGKPLKAAEDGQAKKTHHIFTYFWMIL